MLRHHRFVAVSLVLAVLACVPVALHANTIYRYTGNPFTRFIDGSFPGAYDTSMRVLVTLEFTAPLEANRVFGPVFPVYWSFSDGRQVLNDGNADINTMVLQTDASGAIRQWDMVVFNKLGSLGLIRTFDLTLSLQGGGDGGQIGDFATDPDTGTSDLPGSWVESTIPEPSALILTLLGLGGLAVLRRRQGGLRWGAPPMAVPIPPGSRAAGGRFIHLRSRTAP